MQATLSIFLCLLFTAAVKCDEIETEDGVLVLTQNNFQSAIEDNEFILVEFYAPWCGHCKALAPEYAKAAQQLAEEGSDVKLGKVDATVESELGKEFEVRGYPTLKFFKNGTPKEYTGGRKASDIVGWLNRNTGPAATNLETVEEAKEFIDKEDVVIVGYFESNSSLEAGAYLAAADSGSESLVFGISTEKEVIDGLEATVNTVVVYKKFDDGKVVFSGEWTAEDIMEFIQSEQLPLVTTFSDETAPKIFGGNVKSHLLCFFPSSSEQKDEFLTNLRTVAKDFKGKILVVHIDSAADESERILEFFNIGDDDVPTARLIHMAEDMRRYKPDFSGFDVEPLRQFCQDFVDGNLKPHLNTEEIPDGWNDKPVKVLVGKNFNEVAFDETKDVFVEFYAPWCGHCKQLAPIWDELGEHFNQDEDVVIAKMDSTKNEAAEVHITGFPTLKFFPKGSTKIIDYDGGRTLEELIKFVEAQTGEGEEDDDDDEEEEEDAKRDEL